MSTVSIVRGRSAVEHSLLVIERILRDREGIWQQIRTEYQLNALISQMSASSALSFVCYGLVLGFSNLKYPLEQALASAVKLPLLFFLTLAICLPTLYLFNLLFGARLSVRQALAIVLVAITVTAALTLAFAPISLFFLITAPNHAFSKILNVAILMLTGCVGLKFLISGMRSMNQMALVEQVAGHTEPADEDRGDADRRSPVTRRPVSMGLLNIWIILYAFVGTQLAWTLRPFFGDPGKVVLFRAIEGNFYVDVVHTLLRLFK